MILAPLQTTATPVRASSYRSADTSRLFSPPRWTPPMPPVAMTRMPARGGNADRPGDRGGAHPAGCHHQRQVARRAFGHAVCLGEPDERVGVEPDADDAVDDGDGGRLGALRADRGLDRAAKFEVARPRQTVTDQGRFERHDRPACR